ncbi:MAG TPA: POTRA domain-containing protein [Pyrinomonadaceae bacterium]|nr:POTRA domain-containing protein [Pyrinomonadaceae bacterium]
MRTGFRCDRQIAMAIALLISLCVWSSICMAQRQAHLSKIEVVGLKRLTQEQVIETSGLQIGQAVDPSVLDAASEKLMTSGLFKRLSYRVRTSDGEAIVIFEVEEASRNLPVVFENFVWFSDDEIARAIRQDVPFFDGTAPEAGGTADKIVVALQRLLNAKKIPGRAEFMLSSNEGGKQELLFTVRGVKIPICSLSFPGAAAISEADLIRASQPLLKSDYSKKDIPGFAHYTLFPLYRHIGHLRATFQEPTAKLEADQCPGGVAVTIQVDEGVAYSWDAAEWNGNQALTADELSTAFAMKAGEVADDRKIIAGMKAVRKLYGRKGYIGLRYNESVSFDDAARRVAYRFTFSEGPQYYMGNLIINGVAPEDSQRLKEKWRMAQGAVFDESYMEDFSKTDGQEVIGKIVFARSRSGTRTRIDYETKPDEQKQTVDVIITFK